MIDFLSKFAFANKDKLSSVLKPVEEDMSVLEIKLLDSLSSNNIILDEITSYVFKSGGKKLRSALVFLFGRALNNGILTPAHFYIAEAVEMVHTASLIHDDIIDDAETRRGILTVAKKWNSKTAVIAGDFILAGALKKLVMAGGISTEVFANTLNELCVGEIQQGSQKFKILSLEDYINKSERKTAKLFMAGAECAASNTTAASNLTIKAVRNYTSNFGIAFQIMDDVLNFVGDKSKTGKPAGNDLKNGILTAPVLFALEEYAQKGDHTLKKLIDNKLKDKKDFNHAMSLILKSQGIKKSVELAESYISDAIDAISIIESSVYKKALASLAVYILKKDC